VQQTQQRGIQLDEHTQDNTLSPQLQQGPTLQQGAVPQTAALHHLSEEQCRSLLAPRARSISFGGGGNLAKAITAALGIDSNKTLKEKQWLSSQLNGLVRAAENAAGTASGTLTHVVLEVGNSLATHPRVTFDAKEEGSKAEPRTLHCGAAGLAADAAAAADSAVADSLGQLLAPDAQASATVIMVHALGEQHLFSRHVVQRGSAGGWECTQVGQEHS
jgi:hypothetical protein